MVREKKRNPRNAALILDCLHIVIGILVVICAVLAFLDPDSNQFLFPLIFWMAALLNGVNGWYRLRESGHDKKRKAGSLAQCGAAMGLLLVGIISAVSIWR